ncbi:uncharacterized protein A4U43_C06F10690 [Asparagus officinalis]|uniref:MYB transcription factor n=1 Tax=Asparagus officinalis TaxID=4686 RepID=A0A5P1ELY0_ASPOF|nr:single myb histone 6-like [Asparagus officinalis]ONK66663.1 uncharacterized protein A4U43_C06F10690 [Asparagus officinalis]
MGAPKQKWTEEEEFALKAGIRKHGAGKWRTILKDPEFSGILCLRSNVDLKDKWRNMSVVMNGWGSREKGRIALKKSKQTPRHDENPMALTTGVKDISDEIVEAKPLAMSAGPPQITPPKKSEAKLENLILEAITNLKEPSGSNKTAIAMYIEDQYVSPPDFKRLLSAKLKKMVEARKLVKVKRKYRIAPSSAFTEGRSSKLMLIEGRPREASRVDRDIKQISKSQVDAYLARMRSMTTEEAELAAAEAVAEAEALMTEAEEAAREAEAAEADFEARKAFADAATLTLKKGNAAIMWAGSGT